MRYLKTILLITAMLGAAHTSYAQGFERRNTIMVESNLIMSLHLSYDRIFPVGETTALMIGADYIMGVGFGYGSHWMSPGFGLLLFGPRHYLETAAMYAFDILRGDGDHDNSPGFRLAYRFQGNRGLAISANANFYFNIDPIFIPTIGLGYSF